MYCFINDFLRHSRPQDAVPGPRPALETPQHPDLPRHRLVSGRQPISRRGPWRSATRLCTPPASIWAALAAQIEAGGRIAGFGRHPAALLVQRIQLGVGCFRIQQQVLPQTGDLPVMHEFFAPVGVGSQGQQDFYQQGRVENYVGFLFSLNAGRPQTAS